MFDFMFGLADGFLAFLQRVCGLLNWHAGGLGSPFIALLGYAPTWRWVVTGRRSDARRSRVPLHRYAAHMLRQHVARRSASWPS